MVEIVTWSAKTGSGFSSSHRSRPPQRVLFRSCCTGSSGQPHFLWWSALRGDTSGFAHLHQRVPSHRSRARYGCVWRAGDLYYSVFSFSRCSRKTALRLSLLESFNQSMELSHGEKFGPYTLVSPLGQGGMGEVWKARDTRLNRTVALKVAKSEFGERFEREAHAIAALNHPHICTLHDVGPNYLVMELVEGTVLKGPLPLAKALEYGVQILDALDAAHRKGIVHRDLKPANILSTKQGIKLLDFGLAKQVIGASEADATLTNALTHQGQISGTLQYMSPEQLQGYDADAR